MNELMAILEKDRAELTPEQSDALYMHEQLIIHRQMVEVGLASMCRDLKEIRDRKLFAVLGYDDFCAYTEGEHGIKQRQAYKYIQVYEKLGAEFLHSSAKIGVTKLLEIAALDKEERQELLAEHTTDELAAMSTDEVKRLTEQVKKLEEQIGFLEAEKENVPLPSKVMQQPFSEIEAEIRAEVEEELKAEYEERIFALECKTVSDDELKKFKANAEKEAKAASAAELKKAKDESTEEMKKLKADLKAAKDAQKAKDEAIKKAEEAQKAAEEKAKAGEEAVVRAAVLEAKIAAAEAEKATMEKQIKLSADPELTRFEFLFKEWERCSNSLSAQLKNLSEEMCEKMKTAVKFVLKELEL